MAEAGQPSAIMVSTISLATALKHPEMDKSGRAKLGRGWSGLLEVRFPIAKMAYTCQTLILSQAYETYGADSQKIERLVEYL